MFRKDDPYSYTQFLPLYKGSDTIGLISLDYQVALYNDVQVLTAESVAQPNNQQFIVSCTQRIFINNKNNASASPIQVTDASEEAFTDYPVLFSTWMKIEFAAGLTLNLLDYSPHTVNTSVQQSTSGSTGGTKETSSQSTTGTSHSQSSTYGVSVSLGANGGASTSYEHSTTDTTDKSKTQGSTLSNSNESSNSAAMSIKDWGAYASVHPADVYPSWVFGQEYPWNAIECRYAQDTGNSEQQSQMYVSPSMLANLYDGDFLYPPSELSMYGVNFVMKASWRVYVDYAASTEITITSGIDYYSASHALVADGTDETTMSVNVYMDQVSTTLSVSSKSLTPPSITLDLNIMGLDPLGVNSDAAIVGFIPNKFIPPVSGTAPAPQTFKTISATNDLIIENTTDYPTHHPKRDISGFTVSQTCLTATWSDARDFAYQITLYFKVIDSVNDYTLYLKHWLTQATGVRLQIVVNGDTSNTITKYVDAIEGEGGDNNLLSIALRNLDFASIEYHDYLQLGLNSVTITMEPIDQGWSNCGYQIRAVSIVKS